MSAASILKAIAKLTDKGFPEEVAGRIASGEYPEEVAQRIISGELPMDEASRVARREEQMVPGPLFRGHYAPHPPKSNQDMFMSDSYDNAFTYADVVSDGTVTPLRHNATDLAYVNAGGKHDRSVTTNNIKNPGIRRGVIRGTDEISEAVKYSEKYQGTHFRDLRDDMHNTSSTERANVYNILGSRPDVKIRHEDAAFDPQYNGPNIMGGAAGTAGLAGLLAAGQSDDSEASVASLAKRGLRIVEGHSPAATPSDSLFNIVDGQDKMIGGAEFWATPEGKQYAYAMRLNPEHRGTGIMNEAYDAIEEISGIPIEPSDVLTEDGMKFWIRRDPRKMQELYEGERFDYYEKDVLDSIFAEALEAKRMSRFE